MSNDNQEQGTLGQDGLFALGYGTIPKAVMIDPDISVTAKGIYALLASFAGGGKTAYPSVSYQCHVLGISEDTYKKHRQQLLDKGYIRITPTRVNGKQGANHYSLPSYPVPPARALSRNFQTPKFQGAEIQGAENYPPNKSSFNKNSFNTHTHGEAVQKPSPAREQKPAYASAGADASVCDEWVEFQKTYPKPVPARDRNKAKAVFLSVLQEKGMAYIRQQVAAYLAWEKEQGREERYVKNAGAFLLEGWVTRDYPESVLFKVLNTPQSPELSAEEEAAQKARFAERYEWPESRPCPVCGEPAYRQGETAIYYCSKACCGINVRPVRKAVGE